MGEHRPRSSISYGAAVDRTEGKWDGTAKAQAEGRREVVAALDQTTPPKKEMKRKKRMSHSHSPLSLFSPPLFPAPSRSSSFGASSKKEEENYFFVVPMSHPVGIVSSYRIALSLHFASQASPPIHFFSPIKKVANTHTAVGHNDATTAMDYTSNSHHTKKG